MLYFQIVLVLFYYFNYYNNLINIIDLAILHNTKAQLVFDSIIIYYHYANLTFVCDVRDVRDVRAGGHGKPFDPS